MKKFKKILKFSIFGFLLGTLLSSGKNCLAKSIEISNYPTSYEILEKSPAQPKILFSEEYNNLSTFELEILKKLGVHRLIELKTIQEYKKIKELCIELNKCKSMYESLSEEYQEYGFVEDEKSYDECIKKLHFVRLSLFSIIKNYT